MVKLDLEMKGVALFQGHQVALQFKPDQRHFTQEMSLLARNNVAGFLLEGKFRLQNLWSPPRELTDSSAGHHPAVQGNS